MSVRHPFVAASVAASAAILLIGAPALADTGHITDPAGDYPDIRRLDYNNAASQVVMKLTYATSLADAQNQSFYVSWGGPRKYQVFYSPSAGLKELRFYRNADTWRVVACPGLRLVNDAAARSTTARVPRTCLGQAPDTVQFKGIATQGTSLQDQTRLSPRVPRG